MTPVKKIGLLGATAIVAGNMMGSGIALLPANLAAIGSITLISWLIAIVGGLALAYLFATLGTTNPQEGGLVAYAGEVSPILGYQTGVLYFHANWIGNLAIAMTAVSYLSIFIPALTHAVPAGLTTIGVIWIFAALNLLGAHWIGRLAGIGITVLMIPIVITAIGGWFFFHPETFHANWNISAKSDSRAVMSGVLLCIWSFIGVESASVDANVVENPKRTIPISTLAGTFIAALLYLLSTTVMNGMFDAKTLSSSGAPFSLAINTIIGGHDMSTVVSIITAFACLTSLSSWMLLVAQAGARAAHDGNLPAIFGKLNAKNIPAQSIILTTTFMSLLMLALTLLHQSSGQVFGEIISIAVLLTILPYYYSALNLIHSTQHRAKTFLKMTCGLIVTLFCFMALFGASEYALLATTLLSLGCLIFYAKSDHHPDKTQ
jgi:cadaverine:lysine antiporter